MKTVMLLCLALASTLDYKQTTRPVESKKTVREQVPPPSSASARQKAITFIKQVKKRELTASGFILLDKPAPLASNYCLKAVLTDKQFFSSAELTMLKAQAGNNALAWKATDFSGVRIVEQDTVDAIFNVYSKHWAYFNKHIGRDFNEFSMPIFLRNDTYCLFYEANHCGGLCGEGKLALYKKEGGHWQVVKYYCQWIS
jgi:hypothetical protein